MNKFMFTLRWPIGDTRVVEWADTLEAARARLKRKYPVCEVFAVEDIPVYLRDHRIGEADVSGQTTSATAALEAATAAGQTAT